jgi:hypothetical protein
MMQHHIVITLWDLRVNVVGVGDGSLLVLITGTPDTLHTHTTSSLYIYNAIQHLLQWLAVIRMMQHHIVITLWDLRVNVVGIGGGSLLVLIIGTPHTLHTYIRSTLCMYNAIQVVRRHIVSLLSPYPFVVSSL